ncbi:hypothetical protein DSO57_1000447 [Entomophthora muscae]|uniref:Uncharacterized protein n=1 Tax=Entomophthora muscae TaxID=34485 RepID=A0ACC2UTZ8_9FUNG|nr:hypothetical protein DSO57_1000447 [Entomophthora muscae]
MLGLSSRGLNPKKMWASSPQEVRARVYIPPLDPGFKGKKIVNPDAGSNPEQNPLQTSSSKDWESNSPKPIDKVVVNLPGPESLTTLQDAGSFLEVKILETCSFLDEMHESTNESFSKLHQSSGSGTEPECLPNT